MSSSSTDSNRSDSFSFACVVAADEKNGIGIDGDLPWHLPGDMKFFRDLTIGEGKNAVIMGRKTWQSIPPKFRPLPKRLNIVLSRGDLDLPEGVLLASSLEQALGFAEMEISSNAAQGKIFVIGGSQIYSAALSHPACNRIYLTRVQTTLACHAFLPNLNQDWEEISSSEPIEDNGLIYRLLVLEPK